MLILVYGDDSFRVQEKIKSLQEAFTKKFDPTGLNLSIFQAGAPFGDILQATGSLPFMSPKRMVVVRDLITQSKKTDEKEWEAFTRIPESAIVVFWETSAVEKKPLFNTLKKRSDVHLYPFLPLEGVGLSKWTLERVKMKGGTIATNALKELCERVGSDLWQMDNEIGKLVAFAPKRVIEKCDVEEFVRATFEGEIFALVDAVSCKQGEKAIKLLMQERESGASDFQIFSMLARQVRILLGARSVLDEQVTTPDPSFKRRGVTDQLATDMNIHPFVAQKALQHATSYMLHDLVAVHDLLFRYDAGMKSGFLDAKLAVDLLTTKMITS